MCQIPCKHFIRTSSKFSQLLLASKNSLLPKPNAQNLPQAKSYFSKKTPWKLKSKSMKFSAPRQISPIKLSPIRPSKSNVQSLSIRKKLLVVTSGILGFTFIFFSIKELGRPPVGIDGRPKRDKFSNLPLLAQYIMRAVHEIRYYLSLITSSSSGKLLPDQSKTPAKVKDYTLIVEFSDVLVHKDWNSATGWRYKKRPGFDHFLDTVGKIYEIVLYTAEPAITVFPIIQAMDPKNIISYKLVKNNTLYVDGQHIKDLDNINRQLSRVVVVDWDSNCTKYHPENVLAIPRWSGNDDDTALIYLAQFLVAIADNGIEDVREVVKYYNKFDDPLRVFKEKQSKLVEIAEANAELHKHGDGRGKNLFLPPR